MPVHTFNFDEKEKPMCKTWKEIVEYLEKKWGRWDKLKQCTWKCPACGTQCGGVEGHSGPHQCKFHHEKGTSFKDLMEAHKNGNK